MTKHLDKAIDTVVLNHELVAKFAIAEELRLLNSKLDRMWAELRMRIAGDDEVKERLQLLELRRLKREKKREGAREALHRTGSRRGSLSWGKRIANAAKWVKHFVERTSNVD